MNKTPEEIDNQKIVGNVSVEDGKGGVLEVKDWYVYDSYIVIVTEYDEDFKDLFTCTRDQTDGHFNEDECKVLLKLLLKLVAEMNKRGIYHLDIKPSNFLYNVKTKQVKILDFGHSFYSEDNPWINKNCGTEGLRTPQQVKKKGFHGNDADMWGVAQTIYFCLQGNYAFKSDSEVLSKKLEFKVGVSEECKDLLRRMMSYETRDRLSQSEIIKHPWLEDSNGVPKKKTTAAACLKYFVCERR